MARRTKYNYNNDDFKATAVELNRLPGVLAIHVAETLDIHPVMLYRWRKEFVTTQPNIPPAISSRQNSGYSSSTLGWK